VLDEHGSVSISEPKEVVTALPPSTFPRWFWKPLERLPIPPGHHKRTKDDLAYVAELQGRYVRDTLRALQDIFRREDQILNTGES
jgi:hypothetical protein